MSGSLRMYLSNHEQRLVLRQAQDERYADHSPFDRLRTSGTRIALDSPAAPM